VTFVKNEHTCVSAVLICSLADTILESLLMNVSGQGGTGKRAVYEPSGSQRCKQIVCSKTRAIIIVSIFVVLVLTVALIGSFARIVDTPICAHPGGVSLPTPEPTPATATNGESYPWTSIRLPEAIIPLEYNLFLHPNLTTFLFSGTVTVTIKVLQRTDFIVIHSKGLNITGYELRQKDTGAPLTITRTLEYIPYEQIHIQIDRDLTVGKKYDLTLNYDGEIANKLVGFYRSSYVLANGTRRYVSYFVTNCTFVT